MRRIGTRGALVATALLTTPLLAGGAREGGPVEIDGLRLRIPPPWRSLETVGPGLENSAPRSSVRPPAGLAAGVAPSPKTDARRGAIRVWERDTPAGAGRLVISSAGLPIGVEQWDTGRVRAWVRDSVSRTAVDELKIHRVDVVRVGGAPAYRVRCRAVQGGVAFDQSILLISGARTWLLALSAPPAAFGDLLGSFADLKRSVRVDGGRLLRCGSELWLWLALVSLFLGLGLSRPGEKGARASAAVARRAEHR